MSGGGGNEGVKVRGRVMIEEEGGRCDEGERGDDGG